MRNLTVTRRPTIEVSFTADQWELYGDAKRDEAARLLNQKLQELVNAGVEQRSVMSQMHALMANLGDVGASDSEPRGLLVDALREIFR
jgi:hypothetical protein